MSSENSEPYVRSWRIVGTKPVRTQYIRIPDPRLCTLSHIAACRYLVPIIDLANHREGSPHHVRWEVSTGEGLGGGGTAIVSLQLVAGSDVTEGEEVRVPAIRGAAHPRSTHSSICASCQVTISYGTLRPDEAAIYYGFVPPFVQGTKPAPGSGASRSPLCAIDHPEYDPQTRPGKNAWPRFTGGRLRDQ